MDKISFKQVLIKSISFIKFHIQFLDCDTFDNLAEYRNNL